MATFLNIQLFNTIITHLKFLSLSNSEQIYVDMQKSAIHDRPSLPDNMSYYNMKTLQSEEKTPPVHLVSGVTVELYCSSAVLCLLENRYPVVSPNASLLLTSEKSNSTMVLIVILSLNQATSHEK